MSAWSKAMEWGEGGHLTGTALSALADGRLDVLSSEGTAHLQECEACQGRFADAVVEHVAVGRAMEALPVASEEGAKVPWGWLAATIAMLVVVRAPAVVSSFVDGSWMRDIGHAAHVASLVGWSFCVARTTGVGVVSVGLAALVVAALAAWTMPRPEKI